MPTVATTRFAGFGGDGLAVLAGLREQNTRTYFETHRDTYREQVIEPAKAFVTELADRLRPIAGPGLVAEPRVDGSVFRLHRDVRFSADRAPYKTRQTLYCWEGADRVAGQRAEDGTRLLPEPGARPRRPGRRHDAPG